MMKKYSLVVLLIFAAFSAAAENMEAWSHSASLEFSGTKKYKALFIGEAVYQNALSTLNDIRIVDSEGSFVPYYIQNGTAIIRQNELIYQAQLVEDFKKDNDRYYDFKIIPQKDNKDIAGNLLLLDLPNENFLKHIKIYGSFDGDTWDYIGSDYVFRAAGRDKAALSLGKTKKYTYYRLLTLDNPEYIRFNNLRLSNSYTDASWNSFVKSASAEFTMKNEKNSSILTIANPQKLNIKRIILEIDENFQRPYQLYSDNLSGQIKKSGEVYNLQLENTKVSGTSINLDKQPLFAETLVVKIDNRDDRPLSVKSVKIEYYIDKLVFPDLGNTPYRLYFGNKAALKPQYEIELQKAYIEQEMQDACSLGEITEKAKPTEAESLNMKYILNGIIILVSILLIGLLLPRLKGSR